MTNPIDDALKMLDNLNKEFKEDIEFLDKQEKQQDDYYKKGVIYLQGLITTYLQMLTSVVSLNTLYLQEITKIISALPDSKEFEKIKAEQQRFKKQIEPAIKSMIDLYKQYKEREARAEDLYG